jgi:hypothetical protein
VQGDNLCLDGKLVASIAKIDGSTIEISEQKKGRTFCVVNEKCHLESLPNYDMSIGSYLATDNKSNFAFLEFRKQLKVDGGRFFDDFLQKRFEPYLDSKRQ